MGHQVQTNCFICTSSTTDTEGVPVPRVRIKLPGISSRNDQSLTLTNTELLATQGFHLLCHILSIEIEPISGAEGEDDDPLALRIVDIPFLWVCETKCAQTLIRLRNQVGIYHQVKLGIGKTINHIRRDISWNFNAVISGAGSTEEEEQEFLVNSFRQAFAFTEEEDQNATKVNWNLLTQEVLPKNLYNFVPVQNNETWTSSGDLGLREDLNIVKTEPLDSFDLIHFEEPFALDGETGVSPYSMSELEKINQSADNNGLDDNNYDPEYSPKTDSVKRKPRNSRRLAEKLKRRRQLTRPRGARYRKRKLAERFAGPPPLKVSQVSCTLCGKLFTRASSLKYHERQIHGIGDPLQRTHHCTLCGKSYIRKQHLTEHLRTHSRERDIISKGEEQKEQLLPNLELPPPQPSKSPCNCPTCGKSFTRKESLKYHERQVHGIGGPLERKYRCTFCDKSFLKKQHLTGHLNIHRQNQDTPTSVDKQIQSEKKENAELMHLDSLDMKTEDLDLDSLGFESEHFSSGEDTQDQQTDTAGQDPDFSPVGIRKTKRFNRSSHLTSQTKSAHSTEKHLKCRFCEQAFRSTSSRKCHERNIHNLNGPDREPKSRNPSNNINRRQIPIRCTQCSKICCNEWGRRRHELIVHPTQKEFPCEEPNCGKVCKSWLKLMFHKRLKHFKGPLFTCDKCGPWKTFTSLGRLKKHNTDIHETAAEERKKKIPAYRLEEKGKRHPCPHPNCPATFTKPHNLNLHVTRIHDRGRLQCQKCTKTFETEDDMKKHLWLHQERARRKVQPARTRRNKDDESLQAERIHPCNYCDKKWPRPVDARRHEDRVHKKLMNLCESCGKSFFGMHALWTHMKAVHGLTTWKQQLNCEYCPGKTFNSIGWWETHQRKFHGHEPNVQEVTYQYS